MRAHVSATGAKGARSAAARAFARRLHHEIHAKSDASGDIIAFDLTGGEAADASHFELPLDIGPDIQPRAADCDKSYANKTNRAAARARGIAPVIPANEKDKPKFLAKTLYKARPRMGRIKRFKRVAPTLRKDSQKFPIHRQFRRSPMLDQIRPHGVAMNSP